MTRQTPSPNSPSAWHLTDRGLRELRCIAAIAVPGRNCPQSSGACTATRLTAGPLDVGPSALEHVEAETSA